MILKPGDRYTWSRTFTEDEVRRFTEFSGDSGRHHLEYDDQGRLMVQGLLTASIGTKLGGDMNFIARQMVSEFIRPVFTGDTITCELTVTEVIPMERYRKVAVEMIYRNQHDKEVLLGSSHGIIRDEVS
ncbi:enoyl-CoA hydratase [Brevibacillus ginsengisoli]|uniref:enoyl-CoA hydratase n=1 Tax=Brevibacillus ginsengisoli TaxID=363854 RepID=UPI003CF82EB7